MRFHADHYFGAPLQSVAALLGDPAFYLGLALPDLSKPEVLEAQADGAVSRMRLRYEFVGTLDPIVLRLLGSNRLRWIQEVRLDRMSGVGSLRFAAERDPRRMHGDADFVLSEAGSGTDRRIDGELFVEIPGVGRMAERRIVPGVLRRLDIEAEAVRAQLSPE